MLATHRGPGRPAALNLSDTFVHFAPPSFVTHTKPSSLPAHSTSAVFGLSAIAVIDPCMVRVSSGEIAFWFAPFATDRNTYCAPE